MPIDTLPPRAPQDPSTSGNNPPVVRPISTAFIDVLLGSDLDGQGISAAEIQAALGRLQRVANDGQGNDVAERALLEEIRRSRRSSKPVAIEYQVGDDGIVLRFADANRVVNLPHGNQRPDVHGDIVNAGGVRVIHGDDPGNFYCEHMFFSAQLAASEPGSAVITNHAGEKLVGFLHCPPDPWTGGGGEPSPNRHQGTRKVVGAALRGYFEEIAKAKPRQTPTVLLTGYDTFGWVVNNPTGDFVTSPLNLDAAMAHAWGNLLVTAQGREIGQGDREGPRTFEYKIKHPITGRERALRIAIARFPVDERAIDPDGERSIQTLMKKIQPHGVISMGVAGEGAYKAEHRADAGALVRTPTEHRHDDSAGSEANRLANNFALARAITAGAPSLS